MACEAAGGAQQSASQLLVRRRTETRWQRTPVAEKVATPTRALTVGVAARDSKGKALCITASGTPTVRTAGGRHAAPTSVRAPQVLFDDSAKSAAVPVVVAAVRTGTAAPRTPGSIATRGAAPSPLPVGLPLPEPPHLAPRCVHLVCGPPALLGIAVPMSAQGPTPASVSSRRL